MCGQFGSEKSNWQQFRGGCHPLPFNHQSVGDDHNEEPLYMEGNHSSHALDIFPVFEDV